jgi:hypothetical protein
VSGIIDINCLLVDLLVDHLTILSKVLGSNLSSISVSFKGNISAFCIIIASGSPEHVEEKSEEEEDWSEDSFTKIQEELMRGLSIEQEESKEGG